MDGSFKAGREKGSKEISSPLMKSGRPQTSVTDRSHVCKTVESSVRTHV